MLSNIWYSSMIKSFLKRGIFVFWLILDKWSILPLKKELSVKIDIAPAPDFSYLIAIFSGKYSLIISPALGLAFLISAIIFIFLFFCESLSIFFNPRLFFLGNNYSRVLNEHFDLVISNSSFFFWHISFNKSFIIFN